MRLRCHPSRLAYVRQRNPNKNRSDIPVKGLQYISYTIREVFFDKTVCLARLSDINNDAPDVDEFLHHSTPFFFVLLHFLFKRVVNTGDVYKESDRKRTDRILSACMMRPATGAMKGTLVTKALPVCSAAREVSITPIATSFPPPIEVDSTGSRSAVIMGVRVSKQQQSSNLASLTDRLIGVRKYATNCFPEGKFLALLLHDFVVDGVREEPLSRYEDRLVLAREN